MSDVDRFKDFNDTHGHVAGDEALKAVAKVLREGMRKIDYVARYGGEEFLVILPHTGIAGAVKVAERFRKQLAERSVTVGERSITLTVSTGVAEFPIDGDSPESLIVSADAALYQAKDGGRDRVARASRGRRTTAATSTKKPTATTKKTTGAKRKPTGTAKKTAGTKRKPTGTAKKTAGTTRKPTATAKKTTGTTKKPTGTMKKPTGIKKTTTGTRKKTTGTKKKTAGTPKQTTGTTRKTTKKRTTKKTDES